MKKKTWRISESGGYFQILTHNNYAQTNCMQLEFFYTSLMLGILQQTKELSIAHCKNDNFEFKSWKKDPLKSWAFFSNFKRKINLKFPTLFHISSTIKK